MFKATGITNMPAMPLQLVPNWGSDQLRVSRSQQLVVIVQPAWQLQQTAVTPVVVHQYPCMTPRSGVPQHTGEKA